jgi:hypothetical protein
MEWEPRNFITKAGAEDLAAIIREFWRERGFHVFVWVERVTARADLPEGPRTTYAVRSDMVNGLPAMNAIERDEKRLSLSRL